MTDDDHPLMLQVLNKSGNVGPTDNIDDIMKHLALDHDIHMIVPYFRDESYGNILVTINVPSQTVCFEPSKELATESVFETLRKEYDIEIVRSSA